VGSPGVAASRTEVEDLGDPRSRRQLAPGFEAAAYDGGAMYLCIDPEGDSPPELRRYGTFDPTMRAPPAGGSPCPICLT
jgi:hypothetical protein